MSADHFVTKSPVGQWSETINMAEYFNRNIYTFKSFREDLKFMLSHRKLVKKTMQDLDHAFVEKIMTVVTAVNGCRYCSWFHARQAVSSGISQEEVQRMMKLQFQADEFYFGFFSKKCCKKTT